MTGIRWCGKSFILKGIINELLEKGVCQLEEKVSEQAKQLAEERRKVAQLEALLQKQERVENAPM